MAAGRRRAACRDSRAIDAASRRCAARVRAAIKLNIGYLTVYSFSAENWSRPREEVESLLGLLHRFIRNDLAELHASNVRVRVIGARADLAPDIADLLREAEQVTQAQYRAHPGRRLQLRRAAGDRRGCARARRNGRAGTARARRRSTPKRSRARLDTADIPDPDLIIRTSGEQRLSNFLLWQAAYAEFVFLPILWPDFDEAALSAAIAEYAHRDRRFGGLEAAARSAKTAS